jgi:DNA-binding NtrC family response regulator
MERKLRNGVPPRPGVSRHAVPGDHSEAAEACHNRGDSRATRLAPLAARRKGLTMIRQWQILVVDEEEGMRESLAGWLREDGYRVDTAASRVEGIRLARGHDYALCLIEVKTPGGEDGFETVKEIRRLRPDSSLILIAPRDAVDTAIAAMQEGAEEYVAKPCHPREILLLVERITQIKNLQLENEMLRKRLAGTYDYHDVITKNPRMREILALVRDVASLRTTVLIHGEIGACKEMVARAIHYSGDRADRPFLTVSCTAIAETLLESELFGFERGAFNGALQRTRGKVELAQGGTIFLDEIGDVPPKLQADLLRVLQEGRFSRLGGTQEVQVDVRVIAATHKDLAAEVQEDRFRSDLHEQLKVIEITLPPLRQRREDVPLLARYFLGLLATEMNKHIDDIHEDAMKVLLEYDWPGNVRELKNAVERAMVTCRGRALMVEDFGFLARTLGQKPWVVPPGMTLHELEREAIIATLGRTEGNMKEAASVLGIDRSTLYDKLRRYEIPRPER